MERLLRILKIAALLPVVRTTVPAISSLLLKIRLYPSSFRFKSSKRWFVLTTTPHFLANDVRQLKILSELLLAGKALPSSSIFIGTPLCSNQFWVSVEENTLKAFNKNNTSIQQWSKADIEKWRIVSDKILNQYKATDEITKRLIDSKQAFKKEYNAYYELFGPYDN